MDYQAYDFNVSEKIPKDAMRMISLLQENFSHLVEAGLSGYLRTVVEVNLEGVKQSTNSDFVGEVSATSTFIAVFTLKPLEGNAVLDMSLNLVFSLIDRLLGGKGNSNVPERELTDIEKMIMEKVVYKILDAMQESWVHVINFEPKIEAKETNPQFVQMLSLREQIVLTKIKIKVGDVTGSVRIGIPITMLEPLMSKLNSQQLISGAGKSKDGQDSSNAQLLRNNLDFVKIPVFAHCGNTKLSLRSFLAMKPGDVLKLDPNVLDRVDVLVKDRPRFLAKVGLSGNKKAIKIKQVKER